MNARRDPDLLIKAFLEDGVNELPDRSYDAVRTTIEHTRQWVVIGPWREQQMSRFATFAAAAAVIVLAVVVGLRFLPGDRGSGVGAQPTASPTPTTEPTAERVPTAAPRPTATPEPPDATPAALPEGPFILVHEMLFGVRTTVTIPAPDWHGMRYVTALEKHGTASPPQGAALVVYGGDMFVYGDPCAWESTRPDNPAASLDELVAALSAQASRDATEPIDVTVGGHPGKMLTLQVPEDSVFTDCDGGEFRTLMEVSSSGDEAPRSHQGPGQISEVWVVDVDGTLVYFDAGYFAATPAEYVEEMRATVDSTQFETP